MSSSRRALVDSSVPPVNINARPRRVVSRFHEFLTTCPITVLDVGARGGIPGELEALRSHLRFVAMEPDRAEAERLQERFRSLGLESAAVLPEAGGPAGGEYVLHVTRDPGRSSLLEPNASVTGRYSEAAKYEVTGKVPFRTSAVGPLLERHGVVALDLLKLDVQGFELEILRTLSDAQWDRLLMIECEVEFVELYRGQPLFRHVDEAISARGFELFHLNRVYANYGRGQWVPYGRGQLQFGDAYYLRTNVDALPAEALARLMFLAIYYGFDDYAWHLLRGHGERLRGLPGQAEASFQQHLAPFAAEGRGWSLVLGGHARRVLNKLLYVLLAWRRSNGQSGDNDLYYPTR